MKTGFMFGVIVSACACLLSQNSYAQFVSVDLEDEPIQYSRTDANNRISKLVEDLAKARTAWEYEDGKDYLSRLLKELGIPVSSQVLVFSQTSMQVQHISPRNPRAIYFNDDTYVGWIHGSSLVEISTNDPQLGAAFYKFKYPLSYLIYSEAFDALQPVLRREISLQLQRILDGQNQADEYSHLSIELREQIREIVKATKPGLLR